MTGAGRGMGREHAGLFARRGAKVVVSDVGADLYGGGEGAGPAAAGRLGEMVSNRPPDPAIMPPLALTVHISTDAER